MIEGICPICTGLLREIAVDGEKALRGSFSQKLDGIAEAVSKGAHRAKVAEQLHELASMVRESERSISAERPENSAK